jgi:uncharacterized membrane protein
MTTEQFDAAKGDRTDDTRWKLGLFYYNPDDPALFVEKRFGLGHTVNLANRWAWLVLFVIAVLIVALAGLKY